MSKDKRNNLIIILFILVLLVIGITIVYAALSASLKVTTSNITQNVAGWNIEFETATVKGNKNNMENSSTTGISCGDATVATNSISVGDVTLIKPGDQCYWSITVKNTGSIAAKLTNIEKKDSSETTCSAGANEAQFRCGDILYYLENPRATKATLKSNLHLSIGDVIEPGGSISFQLEAYVPKANTTVSSSQQIQSGFTYTFVWSQN